MGRNSIRHPSAPYFIGSFIEADTNGNMKEAILFIAKEQLGMLREHMSTREELTMRKKVQDAEKSIFAILKPEHDEGALELDFMSESQRASLKQVSKELIMLYELRYGKVAATELEKLIRNTTPIKQTFVIEYMKIR